MFCGSWCADGDKQTDKLAAAGENLLLPFILECAFCYLNEFDMVHVVIVCIERRGYGSYSDNLV